MKVAILSESEADEAAIRILVEGILGSATQPSDPPRLQTRGWPAVYRLLPSVLDHLHYHTEAEALVVVVDGDLSPVHHSSHDEPDGAHQRCRLCQLRACITATQRRLRPRVDGSALKTAIGIAVPAIEAWYLCGIDPNVTEAAWVMGLRSGAYPYTKNRLKEDVYGTNRPSLLQGIQHATMAAQRLVKDLSPLEIWFPNGCGPLMRDVCSWLGP